MQIDFYKYQGTGNDFIMIDARLLSFPEKPSLISKLCHRRFGIGANGLILIKNDINNSDFFMKYFNSNGHQGSLCGNGARCAVAFSKKLGIIAKNTYFNAEDGGHYASIDKNYVSLKMKDVSTIETHPEHVFINTGSPHHIVFAQDIESIDVAKEGSLIRYRIPYFDQGTNVNFVKLLNKKSLCIRTYERGVEEETLSCGTGITAAALAAYYKGYIKYNSVKVYSRGGTLSVNFHEKKGIFTEIWLHGQALCVFQGVISV